MAFAAPWHVFKAAMTSCGVGIPSVNRNRCLLCCTTAASLPRSGSSLGDELVATGLLWLLFCKAAGATVLARRLPSGARLNVVFS